MRTPLHYAIKRREPWAVRILLEHGADSNAHHYYQETSTQYCQRLLEDVPEDEDRNALQEIHHLLATVVPVFSELDKVEQQHGNRGMTALHRATLTLNEFAVIRLLNQGINPNLVDNSKYQAMSGSLYYYYPLQISNLLT